MSNYFTNENINVVNTTRRYGIIAVVDEGSDDTGVKSENITDKFTNSDNISKFASSIPTMLSRLYLFSTPLSEINKEERANPRQAYKFNKDNTSVYPQLVSEWLDLIEFIFIYGDNPDFTIEKWDKTDACNSLSGYGSDAQKKLVPALNTAYEYPAIRDNQHVYLFKWKGKVIGGTSPVTLVYTSANLKTALGNQEFKGEGGNDLFDRGVRHLHQRSESFRKYMYCLQISRTLGNNDLSDYITLTGTNYDNALWNALQALPSATIHTFPGTKEIVDLTAATGLRVLDSTVTIDTTTCDYLLAPTTEIYKKGNANAQCPLVLTEHGLNGTPKPKYAGGQTWNPNNHRIPHVLDEDINNRQLIGFKQKYPYLTIGDFFEEKVIQVSYKLNKDKFFTGSAKDVEFLLPLKKIFFDYFKLSDLFDDNGNYTDMLKMEYLKDHKQLKVSLTLPLVNNRKITLCKVYEDNDVVDCRKPQETFDFAVFPFYRLEDAIDKNVYQVMSGYTKEVKLDFYELTDSDLKHLEVSEHQRLKTADITTKQIKVDSAFSIIEIEIENVKALAIPIFKKVKLSAAKYQYAFSVDFGTTNTYVCCAYDNIGAANNQIGKEEIKEFSYPLKGDQNNPAFTCQTATFHKDSVELFGSFKHELDREFVPLQLNDKFLMRTATYENREEEGKVDLKLFDDSNIGFNYKEDYGQNAKYRTNIKWDISDASAKSRITLYFKQLLWMMKNQSISGQGTNNFRLVATYPISMNNNLLQQFKSAWDNAKAEVKCDVEIKYEVESVAPYYFVENTGNFLNIDIGGGTSDILYINNDQKNYLSLSAKFAADDLWNTGINPNNKARKDNGFLEFYKQKKDIGTKINQHKLTSDIINRLFGTDSDFSERIGADNKMKQLLITHLSALIYYSGYALCVSSCDAPKVLSFSGMGSKYIELISKSSEVLSDIVNGIFRYVANKYDGKESLKNSNTKVIFIPERKECTAKGALLSLNHPGELKPKSPCYHCYADEGNDKLTYNDIKEYSGKVLSEFNIFVEMFKTKDMINLLNTNLDFQFDAEFLELLKSEGEGSMELEKKLKPVTSANGDLYLTEPMFFWPLKEALYNLGKIYGSQQRGNN